MERCWKREAAKTEQFVVPHVLLKHGISFSAVSLSLIRCKIWDLFHGLFQLPISSIGSLSRACSYLSPPLSQTFLLLPALLVPSLSAIRVSREAGSLPPSVLIQPVYTTVSACIHRHTVGTRTSAAYNFRCRCPHSCYPCIVSAHTPTVLPGYLL